MKSVSGAHFAKLLEKHGWELLRVKGSPHIYGKPGRIERISVQSTAINPSRLA